MRHHPSAVPRTPDFWGIVQLVPNGFRPTRRVIAGMYNAPLPPLGSGEVGWARHDQYRTVVDRLFAVNDLAYRLTGRQHIPMLSNRNYMSSMVGYPPIGRITLEVVSVQINPVITHLVRRYGAR